MTMQELSFLHQDLAGLKRIEKELIEKHEWQQDLIMAAEFQRAVLPAQVPVAYLQTEIVSQPYNLVSGDMYDFLLNREKELGIFVGDVTGHGISAALMTMMVHLALDTIRHDLPTDETLRKLNDILAQRQTSRSVTAVYFRICPDGLLTVCHAGHPSLVVLPRDSNEIVQFAEGGCALGMFKTEPVPYREEQYRLQQGDRIIAYTDGVVDCQNIDQEIFAEEQLLDALDYYREHPLAEMKHGLCERLKDFCVGERQRDDITVLFLEYCGEVMK